MLKNLFERYKEVIAYLFFGGLTTVINLLVYSLCRQIFTFSYQISNVIAWFLAVLFAYYTNKWFVFGAKDVKGVQGLRELLTFYLARIFSLVLEMGMMYLLIEKFHFADLPVKISAQVLVILLNYVFSKFLIFRKDEGENL